MSELSEIDALLDRTVKYIESAQMLLESEDFESCVSRVYYAMFYAVEAALLTKKLSFSSHKGVLSAFARHFVKNGIFPKEMSKQLNLAFEKRQLGDYGHTFVICEEEAEELLEIGKDFTEKIRTFITTQQQG